MSLDGKQSHLSAENTHLFLINWNLLVGRQGENFSKNIAGVIDRHNKDENYVPQNTRPEPRIIGGAGSATALVVNAIREQNGERGWNKELAALGLAGILVPTEDLKRNATRQDESAYEFLAGIYGNDFDRSGFYHSIVGGEQRAPPVVAAPVVSRAPVMPSAGVNQATLSGIEPIQGYRTVSEASPEDIHSGGSHQTFTGNRLVSPLVSSLDAAHTNFLTRTPQPMRQSSPSTRRIFTGMATSSPVHQECQVMDLRLPQACKDTDHPLPQELRDTDLLPLLAVVSLALCLTLLLPLVLVQDLQLQILKLTTEVEAELAMEVKVKLATTLATEVEAA